MSDEDIVKAFNLFEEHVPHSSDLWLALLRTMIARGYTASSDKNGGVNFTKGEKVFNIE